MAVRSLWSTATHISTHTPVLSGNTACASMTMPGAGHYDVALLPVDAAGAPFGAPLAVSAAIQVVSASSRFTGKICSFKGDITISVWWDISNPFYNDWVGVFNSKGTMLAWVYTATKTQVVPTALQPSSKASSALLTITGSNIANNGDTWNLRYFPSGSGNFYVAGSNNVDVPSNCFPPPTTQPATTQRAPTTRPAAPPTTQPPTTQRPQRSRQR